MLAIALRLGDGFFVIPASEPTLVYVRRAGIGGKFVAMGLRGSANAGVGGGILAIAPGKASIAVWSPGLDPTGNSHLGRTALETLTKRMGWSIFGV